MFPPPVASTAVTFTERALAEAGMPHAPFKIKVSLTPETRGVVKRVSRMRQGSVV
jgi:hypothetical protein